MITSRLHAHLFLLPCHLVGPPLSSPTNDRFFALVLPPALYLSFTREEYLPTSSPPSSLNEHGQVTLASGRPLRLLRRGISMVPPEAARSLELEHGRQRQSRQRQRLARKRQRPWPRSSVGMGHFDDRLGLRHDFDVSGRDHHCRGDANSSHFNCHCHLFCCC